MIGTVQKDVKLDNDNGVKRPTLNSVPSVKEKPDIKIIPDKEVVQYHSNGINDEYYFCLVNTILLLNINCFC